MTSSRYVTVLGRADSPRLDDVPVACYATGPLLVTFDVHEHNHVLPHSTWWAQLRARVFYATAFIRDARAGIHHHADDHRSSAHAAQGLRGDARRPSP